MSEEDDILYQRKTHFQGFSRLAYPELRHYFHLLGNAKLERNTYQEEKLEYLIRQILTQYAYDLALFLFENADPLYLDVKRSYHDRPGEGVHDYHQFIKQLPDIDKWPDK